MIGRLLSRVRGRRDGVQADLDAARERRVHVVRPAPSSPEEVTASSTECKLCTRPARTRRISPFGTANLCGLHAAQFDAWANTRTPPPRPRAEVLDLLLAAFKYGPKADPVLAVRDPELAGFTVLG